MLSDLGDFAAPVVRGGQLVHFLSDQQWVSHWLLYSGTDGSEAVVVTERPLGVEADEDSPRTFERELDPSASSEAAVCAESFAEFLYRFWIENEIWFAHADEGRPLTDEQRRYAEHYLH